MYFISEKKSSFGVCLKPRKWFSETMKELEKFSRREDAGELTVYTTTVFFHTDEIIEVCCFVA